MEEVQSNNVKQEKAFMLYALRRNSWEKRFENLLRNKFLEHMEFVTDGEVQEEEAD